MDISTITQAVLAIQQQRATITNRVYQEMKGVRPETPAAPSQSPAWVNSLRPVAKTLTTSNQEKITQLQTDLAKEREALEKQERLRASNKQKGTDPTRQMFGHRPGLVNAPVPTMLKRTRERVAEIEHEIGLLQNPFRQG